ncbi:hypothetical protein ACLM5J_13280 [Nocardioides sp. Bht2]|uniref:hypothetical protein n=1 Tax=Nocardioides sp. Bht2 TaxID=3392297 RepID=UPI0039B40E6A
MPSSRPALHRRAVGAAVLAAATLGIVGILQSTTDARSPNEPPVRSDSFTVLGSPPTQRPELSAPRDPLTGAEVGYAVHLAATDASLPRSATDVTGDNGAEVLTVELPAEVVPDRRLAVVGLYDYTAGQGYQQTVDLGSGQVRSTRNLAEAKISADEARVAVQLAIDHDPALTFTAEFQAAQGTPLVSADQIGYAAGAFTFDGSTAGGDRCGAHRCAQLLLRLPNGTYLTTTDFVVDLSARAVVRLR